LIRVYLIEFIRESNKQQLSWEGPGFGNYRERANSVTTI